MDRTEHDYTYLNLLTFSSNPESSNTPNLQNTVSRLPTVQVLQELPQNDKIDFKWSENNSKLLLDLYASFKQKVGTMAIKNFKMLWEVIAKELQNRNVQVTPNNCLNRWRVLERNYKKFIDNKKQTGRGKRYFEYEKEMEMIFQGKRSIRPEVVLASDTIDQLPEKPQSQESIEEKEHDVQTHTIPRKKRIVVSHNKNRMSTIEKMRLDRKTYYEQRLKLEQKKSYGKKEYTY